MEPESDPSATPLVIVDKRRIKVLGAEVVEDPNMPANPGMMLVSKDVMPEPPSMPAPMYQGEFYEINGICYFVRKVTPRDIVLRRFTGSLALPKVHATALQLKGARPA